MARFSGKSLKVSQSELTDGFIELAPGTYRAVVADVSEIKEYKTQNENSKGLHYFDVTYKIVEAPEGLAGKGATIKHMRVPIERKWNSGKVNYTFDQFWRAVGAYDQEAGSFTLPGSEDEFNELVDPDFTVVVTIKEEPGFKDPTRLYPAVARVSADNGQELKALPRTEASAAAPAASAIAQSSGPVTSSTQTKWTF
jgi:hypothetical protein|nr:MAG TPA: hypothetical protein [Caudoviricetes sp.]